MSDKGKATINGIYFFKANLEELYELRPRMQSIDEKIIRQTNAINTSIVLNCFALFEACLESYLLDKINMKKLDGIHKNIVFRYIKDIIKISSISNYNKEFKFITGTDIKDELDETAFESYKVIVMFYPLRHYLVHGSVTIHDTVRKDNKGIYFELSSENANYKELLVFLSKKFNKKIADFKNKDPYTLVFQHETVDLLYEAICVFHKKITEEIYYGGRYLTEIY